MKKNKLLIVFIFVFLLSISFSVTHDIRIYMALHNHQYLQAIQLLNHHDASLEKKLYQFINGTSFITGSQNFSFITRDGRVCQVDFSGEYRIIEQMNNAVSICQGDDAIICAITEDGYFIPSFIFETKQLEKELELSNIVGAGSATVIRNIKQYEMITDATFFRSCYPMDGMFVHADGSVTLIGCASLLSEEEQLIIEDSWNNVIQLAKSDDDLVGLSRDGSILCSNDSPYCDVYKTWTDITAIYGSGNHIFALTGTGTIKSTGEDWWGESDVSSWQNIISVSAARTHTVGLKADGTVVATGANNYGQCDVQDWKDIIAIATYETFTLGIDTEGTIWVTGKTDKTINIEACSDIISKQFTLLSSHYH